MAGMATPDPERLGKDLRACRKAAGLRRHQAAAATGIPFRDVAAFERGRAYPANRQLERLAEAYGVKTDDLIPPRVGVGIDFERKTLRVSTTVRILGDSDTSEERLLREYLTLLRAMRGAPAGASISLRDDDLDALARALGGSPDRIEERLADLMGISPEAAARLGERLKPHPRPVVGS